MRVRTTVILAPLWMSACGSSSDAPAAISPPPSLQKADVIVTIDGEHHNCSVALSQEQQGSMVACGDIVAFINDELRLPSGATYDLRTIATVSETESVAVKEKLKTAGYRFVRDP